MELIEKAKNYAEENVIEVLKEAFAKVYADGYRDGYKDREEEIPVDLRDNKTKFVDLGLPSGTLWSTDYEKEDSGILFLPYDKALKYNLPTEEQCKELLETCKWQGDFSSSGMSLYGVTCIGPNGNSIKFRTEGFQKDKLHVCFPSYGGGQAYYWIKDDGDSSEKKALRFHNLDSKKHPHMQLYHEITEMFSGYKLPIRLVKTK